MMLTVLAAALEDLASAERELRELSQTAPYLWAAGTAADADVLDAGCGTGAGATSLVEGGARSVVAVDIDPRAVTQASATVPASARILLADIADLPFASSAFDLVVCFDVIEHAPEPLRALGELRRVLRPDGRLLISLPPAEWLMPDSPPGMGPITGTEFPQLLARHFVRVDLRSWTACLAASLAPASPGTSSVTGLAVARLAVASVGKASRASGELVVAGPAVDLIRRRGELTAAANRLEETMAALHEQRADAAADRGHLAEVERQLAEAEAVIRTFESSWLGRIGRLLYRVRELASR
jgi:SAM-dependent methyltransferase